MTHSRYKRNNFKSLYIFPSLYLAMVFCFYIKLLESLYQPTGGISAVGDWRDLSDEVLKFTEINPYREAIILVQNI